MLLQTVITPSIPAVKYRGARAHPTIAPQPMLDTYVPATMPSVLAGMESRDIRPAAVPVTPQVENNMTSVERMLEYAELPQEPPRCGESLIPDV